MTFYKISDAQFTRLYHQEMEICFSALDCILNGEKAIYASSELTTGIRLYNALREAGVKTAADLKQVKGKDWYSENLWDVNVRSACEFAGRIRTRDQQESLVVTPAPFSAPDWTQPEYLAFWEQLLRTRIHAVWFNLHWQYSNGCTFEFAVGVDAGLSLFDHEGRELGTRQGAQLIEAAIQTLEKDQFDTSKLRENLARLQPASARAR